MSPHCGHRISEMSAMLSKQQGPMFTPQVFSTRREHLATANIFVPGELQRLTVSEGESPSKLHSDRRVGVECQRAAEGDWPGTMSVAVNQTAAGMK